MDAPLAPRTLPDVLPLFPLTGVLLLPGMHLPLHIFEPRYRALVHHALDTTGMIGMVQPRTPRPDNRAPMETPEDTGQEAPELYAVGCAGKILHPQQTEDGRYLITLAGVSRYRIVEELPLQDGFRRARVEYGEFPNESDLPARLEGLEEAALLKDVEAYLGTQGVALAPEPLSGMAHGLLVNALGMMLPFAPAEKQALLEAPDLPARLFLLRTLLALGDIALGDARYTPPTTN